MIAPRPIADLQSQAVRRSCIGFMPMLPGYEPIRATVARAVDRSGLVLRRLEELLTDPEWQLWLLDTLPNAPLALVDVTDHNPFVMYELGLAHSRRVPAILIMNLRNPRVTATVLGTPFLPYDELALDAAEDTLVRWITLQQEASLAPVPPGPDHHDDARYAFGQVLVDQFRADTGVPVVAISRDEFVLRRRVAEGRGDAVRDFANSQWTALQTLPRIVQNADDVTVMGALVKWSLSSQPHAVARHSLDA